MVTRGALLAPLYLATELSTCEAAADPHGDCRGLLALAGVLMGEAPDLAGVYCSLREVPPERGGGVA